MIILTVVLYVLALIGFGADLSGVSQRRSDARLRSREAARVPVGAGAPAIGAGGGAEAGAGGGSFAADDDERASALESRDSGPAADGIADGRGAEGDARPAGALTARGFGFVMAAIGAVLHVGAMVLRGIATQRVPWGNMYEFSMTSSAMIVVVFLLFAIRRKDLRLLGTFVILPVLVLMLIAQTAWILPAAELTPSLQNSYWVVIHVGIAIIATALSGLGALIAVLQLVQARHERTLAAQHAAGETRPQAWGRAGAVLSRLPGATALEALCFRIHALAFVCWTFTLIFGAVWANDAWGRYWNWDPKEVWTFVIWVVYACYLHARATRGFRGSKAAWFALAGFACVVINYTVVNLWINGLHSYSGL
nr:c-type cytochrome biogenesis protein CcsB [Brachybacterium equifaecis]